MTTKASIGQPHLFEPPPKETLKLHERFLVPPFSVLDARAGYWQARKQEWLQVGIEGELGRSEQLEEKAIYGSDADLRQRWEGSAYPRGARARELAAAEAAGMDSSAGRGDRLLSGGAPRAGYGGDYDLSKGENAWGGKGTSVFDPVLCELAYRWYSPDGGLVADPFAGGSVRGIVAAALGRRYVGTDLSVAQIEANYQQVPTVKRALSDWRYDPRWEHADARNLLEHVDEGTADFIFTCPPYYDLEVYSDDPADLSRAATYNEFVLGYRQCIAAAAAALRPDRFAVIVVGEVRDKKTGRYVGLVPDTIRACEDAGLSFYNEGILVTSVGSLPIRTSRLFGPGRKLGKSHQNVLVFVKGSWKAACAACALTDEVAVEYGGATVASEGNGALEQDITAEQLAERLEQGDTSTPAF
jgi:DNA modification methylase